MHERLRRLTLKKQLAISPLSPRANTTSERSECSINAADNEFVDELLVVKHCLAQHADSVLAVVFAPSPVLGDNGGTLFSGDQDGAILEWDLNTFTCTGSLDGHERQVVALHLPSRLYYTNDTPLLVSAARDNTIRVWSRQSHYCLFNLIGFPSCVFDITTIGSTLYGGCMDTSMLQVQVDKLFDEYGPKAVKEAQPIVIEASHVSKYKRGHFGYVYTLLVSHDECLLFSGSADFTIRVWTPDLQLVQVLKAHTNSVVCLTLLDQQMLLSGSSDGSVKVWSLSSQPIHLVRSINVHYAVLAFTIFNSFLLVSTTNAEIIALDGHSFCVVRTVPLYTDANILSISASDQLVFSGDTDAKVLVWSMSAHSAQATSKAEFSVLTPFSRLDVGVCIKQLLTRAGLLVLHPKFEEFEVDITALRLMSDADLIEMGLSLGARRKLIAASLSLDDGSAGKLSSNLTCLLQQLVGIESVSVDPTRYVACWNCGRFLESFLQSIGFETRLRQIRCERSPILTARIGHLPEVSNRPKIIVYAHYDVVPACETNWCTPPFTLTGINGFLYGRGASDNKGPIVAFIHAVKELVDELGSCPAEVVFLLEGEGERDSFAGGLENAVKMSKDWLGGADVIVLSNAVWVGETTPCLNYGMRAVVNINIDVEGPSRDLHSGVHGGCFNEPMIDLVKVIASIIDDNGRVCIPQFYQDVLPVSQAEEELYSNLDFNVSDYEKQVGVKILKSSDRTELLMRRWRQPCLSVHGFCAGTPSDDSTGKFSIIAKFARAKLSMRLVPDQDSSHIIAQLNAHVNKIFNAFHSCNRVNVEIAQSGEWWLADTNSMFYNAAAYAIERIWKCTPNLIREGGTMASTRFLERELNAPAVHIPFGQATDQAHLGNERIRIVNLERGKDVFKFFIKRVVEKLTNTIL